MGFGILRGFLGFRLKNHQRPLHRGELENKKVVVFVIYSCYKMVVPFRLCVAARNLPQWLKPEGLTSFTAGLKTGLKTCSTPSWDTVKLKKV